MKFWAPTRFSLASAIRTLGPSFALSLVALALATSPAQGAETHAEYVSRVNQICAKTLHAAGKIPNRIPPSGDKFADRLRAFARFNKLFGRGVRRAAAVDPAPGYERAVRAWIHGLRRQKRLVDRFIAAVKQGRPKKAKVAWKRASRLGGVGGPNRRRASELGLTECG